MKPTIYDIAKKAGVSKSTVSRVINNQPGTSTKAKEKVHRVIEELDFSPSILARGLSKKGINAISVMYTQPAKKTIENPYFSTIILSISSYFEEVDFDVILQSTLSYEKAIRETREKVKQNLIKGLILLSSPIEPKLYQELDRLGIPIIVIGKVEDDYDNITSIDTDNYLDSYELTQYLINKGHTKLGCLHASQDYYVGQERLNGFLDCLKNNKLEINPDWIIDGELGQEGDIKGAQKLLNNKELPTAIFATDDLKALQLYRAAHMKGLKLPEELSIVGHNNYIFSETMTPALTTINVPIHQLGIQSSKTLFSKISKSNLFMNKNYFLQTRLIERESVYDLSAKINPSKN